MGAGPKEGVLNWGHSWLAKLCCNKTTGTGMWEVVYSSQINNFSES